MRNPGVGYWLRKKNTPMAITLAEHAPGQEARENSLKEILDYTIDNGPNIFIGQILEKLDRLMTDQERVSYCSKRWFSKDPYILESAREVALDIIDETLRLDTSRKIDQGFINAGFPSTVEVMTKDEIISWVVEQIGRGYDNNAAIKLLFALYPAEFEDSLISERKKAVSKGDERKASSIVEAMGGTRLSQHELRDIYDVMKKNVMEQRHAAIIRDGLHSLVKIAKMLPKKHRSQELAWIAGIFIRINWDTEARDLFPEMNECDYQPLAEKVLKRQLDHKSSANLHDFWETEKWIGRNMTDDELRLGLACTHNEEAHLQLIPRLPEEERSAPYEKLLQGYIKSHNFIMVIKVAALIPRELTLEELYSMISSAESSRTFWYNQRNSELGMVKKCEETIELVSHYIANLPLMVQV